MNGGRGGEWVDRKRPEEEFDVTPADGVEKGAQKENMLCKRETTRLPLDLPHAPYAARF